MAVDRALITGGAGFIGSRLALRLKALHQQVCVFDSFHPQAHTGQEVSGRALALAGVQVLRGDVRDQGALTSAIEQADPQIVYHLAAETGTGQSFDLPARYCDVNVTGTANLIEAVRGHGRSVRRVVLAGSRSVYGEGACVDAAGLPALAVERLPSDLARGDFAPKDARGRTLTPVKSSATCPVRPASIYASSKLMQECLLRQGFWGTDVDVGIVRFQNIFGAGQSLNNPYTGVLSIFCRQLFDGRTLDIFEDGAIVRDFLGVDDAVSALEMMGTAAQMPTEILDIGSGEGVSILDVARRLMALVGVDSSRVRVSGAFRPGDIRHAVADITLARDLLGWAPRNDFDNGLARLVEWSRGPHNCVA